MIGDVKSMILGGVSCGVFDGRRLSFFLILFYTRVELIYRASAGKESACNAEDLGFIPELGRSPGGGHGEPLWYSCLDNPHGQRSLAGYSPWGRKEFRHD